MFVCHLISFHYKHNIAFAKVAVKQMFTKPYESGSLYFSSLASLQTKCNKFNVLAIQLSHILLLHCHNFQNNNEAIYVYIYIFVLILKWVWFYVYYRTLRDTNKPFLSTTLEQYFIQNYSRGVKKHTFYVLYYSLHLISYDWYGSRNRLRVKVQLGKTYHEISMYKL